MITNKLNSFIPANAKAETFGNNVAFKVSEGDIVALANDLKQNKHLTLKHITATDERGENGCFKIWYIFGSLETHNFIIPYIELRGTEKFPSLTPTIHEAWNLERKVRTFFGLEPVGHPDPRPIILHENWPTNVFPLRKDFDWKKRVNQSRGTYEFARIEGEGIYEIPVGPIHAGIIEPGHFRFNVAGEEIMLLEARLGFVHKGTEKLFEVLPLKDKLKLSEKISGDSSFGHSLAFCQTIEELAHITVPKRAKYLRVIFAELERVANHLGDIGAIMIDTGFNFGGANGARLREMVLQIHEKLSGNRFLRGVNTFGGVTKDVSAEENSWLIAELAKIEKDFNEVIDIAEESASLQNRLERTGVLTQKVAEDHGVVGVPRRAIGTTIDTRHDFPYAAYDELFTSPIATETTGDVYARFHVRIKEVRIAIEMITRALKTIPEGDISSNAPIVLAKNALSVSAIEGWRGEIVYLVTTDATGNIARVAPRDPSFFNWAAVGHAGPGNIVPDFPLINKSFNLSYSGNDL
jgi:Ni,Fe-hydrogenase III large subunit/Ni,Fe-hydrogenase III component G